MSVRVDDQDGIRTVTIDRPTKRNAVDADTAELLDRAFTGFASDDSLKVAILTGAGGNFCAGADLTSAGNMIGRPRAAEAGPMGMSRLEMPKPVIAAVNGACVAGGLELACWADFRVASPDAFFGVLNRRWGVPLIDGGTQRLPRIVGLSNALWLIESGIRIDAERALAIGLVSELVGDPLRRATELAQAMCAYPQASLRADRASAIAADGIAAEAERGEATLSDPEMLEGLRRFASGDRPEPPEPGR